MTTTQTAAGRSEEARRKARRRWIPPENPKSVQELVGDEIEEKKVRAAVRRMGETLSGYCWYLYGSAMRTRMLEETRTYEEVTAGPLALLACHGKRKRRERLRDALPAGDRTVEYLTDHVREEHAEEAGYRRKMDANGRMTKEIETIDGEDVATPPEMSAAGLDCEVLHQLPAYLVDEGPLDEAALACLELEAETAGWLRAAEQDVTGPLGKLLCEHLAGPDNELETQYEELLLESVPYGEPEDGEEAGAGLNPVWRIREARNRAAHGRLAEQLRRTSEDGVPVAAIRMEKTPNGGKDGGELSVRCAGCDTVLTAAEPGTALRPGLLRCAACGKNPLWFLVRRPPPAPGETARAGAQHVIGHAADRVRAWNAAEPMLRMLDDLGREPRKRGRPTDLDDLLGTAGGTKETDVRHAEWEAAGASWEGARPNENEPAPGSPAGIESLELWSVGG